MQKTNYFMYLLSSMMLWLSELGINTSQLIEETELNEKDLNNPSQRVRPEDLNKVISKAFLMTQDPALGLHFGQQFSILSFGIVGQAMAHCRNLGDAIDLFSMYYKNYLRVLNIDFSYDPEGLSVKLETPDLIGEQQRFFIDAGASTAVKLVSELVKGNYEVQGIFKLDNGEYLDDYRRLLSDEVVFNQSENSILFRKLNPEAKLVFSNPVIESATRRILEKELEHIDENDGLITDVKTALKANMKRGLSFSEVAKLLGYSPRNLRRALAKRENSFRKISTEIKRDYAINLLFETKDSIEEIGQTVGYDSYANFSRAFKNWTGMSPAEFRRHKRKQ